MKILLKLVVIVATSLTGFSVGYAEGCGKLNASPESYGYARQLDCRLAQESNKELDVILNTLVNNLQSHSITKDAQYDAMGIELLQGEHKSWLAYRNEHCGLQAHYYAYPAGSKLSVQMYHRCMKNLNLSRIKFLSNMNKEILL